MWSLLVGCCCCVGAPLQSVKQSYPLQTIDQVIREIARSKHPQFRAFGTLLQSGCGQALRGILSDPNTVNTMFIPTDGALLACLDPPVPIRGFTCSANASCTESPLPLKGGYPSAAVLSCLPEILQLHVVPGQAIITPSNQTIIYQSASGGPLVAKGDEVRFAAGPTAKIIRANISCANGNLQIIDRLMVPAANLTRSLEAMNLTSLSQAVRYQGQEINLLNLTEATFFLPLKQPIANAPLNLTRYTVPGQIIWNNRTGEDSTMQVTTLADTPLHITFTGNQSMLVDNQPVVLANIPVANGVLHLIRM